jgi:predicted secreted Zn-dependent protease
MLTDEKGSVATVTIANIYQSNGGIHGDSVRRLTRRISFLPGGLRSNSSPICSRISPGEKSNAEPDWLRIRIN